VGDDAVFAAPAWAHRHGLDGYGPWAEFDIPARSGPVTQRLRWIPPGEFWMGSPEAEAERIGDGERAETLHRVLLSQGYWLADTACTQALWEAVLGENPSNFREDPSNPVEQVRWKDIQEKFLPALNRLLPGLEAGLPSEAQWEYACRAGTQTPFWFGEQITPEQVNYDGNYPYAGGEKGEYREKTVPVKSLPANGWGLYEMHGNVWEWCEDVQGDDPSEAVVDPVGPQDGVEGRRRVLRGGSWISFGRSCRSASRFAGEPDARNGSFGFRLARGLGVPPPAGQGAGGARGQRAEPVATKRRAKAEAGTAAKTRKGAA
jgi:formylglycine-generating enzyme required for sulfatase activity